MEEGKTVDNINIGRGQRAGAGERSLQTCRGRAVIGPIGRILFIEMEAFFWWLLLQTERVTVLRGPGPPPPADNMTALPDRTVRPRVKATILVSALKTS